MSGLRSCCSRSGRCSCNGTPVDGAREGRRGYARSVESQICSRCGEPNSDARTAGEPAVCVHCLSSEELIELLGRVDEREEALHEFVRLADITAEQQGVTREAAIRALLESHVGSRDDIERQWARSWLDALNRLTG